MARRPSSRCPCSSAPGATPTAEEARPDELLDRTAEGRLDGPGTGEVVERAARADDPELAVEDDEDPAERAEDRLERPEAGGSQRGRVGGGQGGGHWRNLFVPGARLFHPEGAHDVDLFR
jgi:hypothetical protein